MYLNEVKRSGSFKGEKGTASVRMSPMVSGGYGSINKAAQGTAAGGSNNKN